MSTGLKFLVPVAIIAVLFAGGTGNCRAESAVSNTEAPALANNAFALALYAALSAQDGNLIFSPCSLSSVLSATCAGARGKTSRQMARMLRVPPDLARSLIPWADMVRDLKDRGQKDQYKLVLANALWVNKGQDVLPDFKDLVKAWPNTGIREADFAGSPEAGIRSINMWTEKHTAGKVKGLVPAGTVGPTARLVLTSAAHVSGLWALPFSEDSTGHAPFQTVEGESVTVPMMSQTGKFLHLGEKNFQILEMDYRGKGISLVAILPKTPNGLPELEKDLTLENLNDWLSRLVETQVSVYFPKFSLSSGFVLVETLTAMGMIDAFAVPPADFSGIDGNKDLAIDQVVHKASVGMNERGSDPSGPGSPAAEENVSFAETEFAADHPFLFVIRDKQSGIILLMGRVVNPVKRAGKG